MNKIEMYLFIKFKNPTIPLENVCEEYFGFSKGTAKQKAKSQTLPIPAFRLGNSQKSPWLVSLTDLAGFIDLNHNLAKAQWGDFIEK